MVQIPTVLVVPPNDPEAVLILQLAKAIEIQTIVSHQPHGASLDRERDLVGLVKAGAWKRVVVIEMPGPKIEAKIRALWVELVIIDHHHYTDLDRAHDTKTKKLLPSSLEQFLKLFRVTDKKLKALGFDPKLVRGTAIMDRGFVWALRAEGYSEQDIRRVMDYQKQLMATVRSSKEEDRKDEVARKAWEKRQNWNGYLVVETDTAVEVRPRVSLIIALELKKPTPVIFVEKKRGLIYVQESDQAMALFKRFGGFTFGMDRCWGFKNGAGKRVGLADVKAFLS